MTSSSGQLDGERHVVESPAQLADRLVRLEARPSAEELDGVRVRQRRHRVLHLAADPQQLSTRDHGPQPRAGFEQLSKLGRGVRDLLEVVQHEQEVSVGDVLREVGLRPERPGEGLGDEPRIAQR